MLRQQAVPVQQVELDLSVSTSALYYPSKHRRYPGDKRGGINIIVEENEKIIFFVIKAQGWCQGRARGATAPRWRHLAPCRRKFWVLIGGNLAK